MTIWVINLIVIITCVSLLRAKNIRLSQKWKMWKRAKPSRSLIMRRINISRQNNPYISLMRAMVIKILILNYPLRWLNLKLKLMIKLTGLTKSWSFQITKKHITRKPNQTYLRSQVLRNNSKMLYKRDSWPLKTIIKQSKHCSIKLI